jgi:hypothetical protein
LVTASSEILDGEDKFLSFLQDGLEKPHLQLKFDDGGHFTSEPLLHHIMLRCINYVDKSLKDGLSFLDMYWASIADVVSQDAT